MIYCLSFIYDKIKGFTELNQRGIKMYHVYLENGLYHLRYYDTADMLIY